VKVTRKQLRNMITEAIRDVKYFDDNIDSIDIDSVSKKDLISMYGNRTGKLAIGGKINNFQKLFGMIDLDVDVFFVPKQLLFTAFKHYAASVMSVPLTGDIAGVFNPMQTVINNEKSTSAIKFKSKLSSLVSGTSSEEIDKLINNINNDGLTIIVQTKKGTVQPQDNFLDINMPWILHDIGHSVLDVESPDIFDIFKSKKGVFGKTGYRARGGDALGGERIDLMLQEKYPDLYKFFQENNFTKTLQPHDVYASLFAYYLVYKDFPPELDGEDRGRLGYIFDNVIESLKGRVYIMDMYELKKQ
jgi:hypothetical protein